MALQEADSQVTSTFGLSADGIEIIVTDSGSIGTTSNFALSADGQDFVDSGLIETFTYAVTGITPGKITGETIPPESPSIPGPIIITDKTGIEIDLSLLGIDWEMGETYTFEVEPEFVTDKNDRMFEHQEDFGTIQITANGPMYIWKTSTNSDSDYRQYDNNYIWLKFDRNVFVNMESTAQRISIWKIDENENLNYVFEWDAKKSWTNQERDGVITLTPTIDQPDTFGWYPYNPNQTFSWSITDPISRYHFNDQNILKHPYISGSQYWWNTKVNPRGDNLLKTFWPFEPKVMTDYPLEQDNYLSWPSFQTRFWTTELLLDTRGLGLKEGETYRVIIDANLFFDADNFYNQQLTFDFTPNVLGLIENLPMISNFNLLGANPGQGGVIVYANSFSSDSYDLNYSDLPIYSTVNLPKYPNITLARQYSGSTPTNKVNSYTLGYKQVNTYELTNVWPNPTLTQLTSSITGTNASFGFKTAASTNYLAVGDPLNYQVRIYRRSDSALISTVTGTAGSYFGLSVDMNDTHLIVGAPGINRITDSGSISVYTMSNGVPTSLRGHNGPFSFGSNVEIRGNYYFASQGAIGVATPLVRSFQIVNGSEQSSGIPYFTPNLTDYPYAKMWAVSGDGSYYCVVRLDGTEIFIDKITVGNTSPEFSIPAADSLIQNSELAAGPWSLDMDGDYLAILYNNYFSTVQQSTGNTELSRIIQIRKMQSQFESDEKIFQISVADGISGYRVPAIKYKSISLSGNYVGVAGSSGTNYYCIQKTISASINSNFTLMIRNFINFTANITGTFSHYCSPRRRAGLFAPEYGNVTLICNAGVRRPFVSNMSSTTSFYAAPGFTKEFSLTVNTTSTVSINVKKNVELLSSLNVVSSMITEISVNIIIFEFSASLTALGLKNSIYNSIVVGSGISYRISDSLNDNVLVFVPDNFSNPISRLYNSDGSILHTFELPTAFSNDGYAGALTSDKVLLSSRGNQSAYIYDKTSGSLLTTINNPRPQSTTSRFGYAVSMSDNYYCIAADYADENVNIGTTNEGMVFVYSNSTNALLYSIMPTTTDQSYSGTDVKITNTHLILSSYAGAFVYDLSTGNQLYNIPNIFLDVNSIDVDINNNRFVCIQTISGQNYAHIYSLSTGNLERYINEITDKISLSGNYLAIENNSNQIKIYDVTDGSLIMTINRPSEFTTQSITWLSHSNRTIYAMYSGGKLYIFKY